MDGAEASTPSSFYLGRKFGRMYGVGTSADNSSGSAIQNAHLGDCTPNARGSTVTAWTNLAPDVHGVSWLVDENSLIAFGNQSTNLFADL